MMMSKNEKDNWILGLMLFWIAIIFSSIFFEKWIIMGIGIILMFITIHFENKLNDKFLEEGILFDDKLSCSKQIQIM